MRIDAVAAIADAKDECGTTMVECALLASLIAVVCIASVNMAGQAMAEKTFQPLGNTLAQAAGGVDPGGGGGSGGPAGAAGPSGGSAGSPPGLPGGPPPVPPN